jgi:hypothetical protein
MSVTWRLNCYMCGMRCQYIYDYIQKLYDSLSRRCRQIIFQKGDTKYKLHHTIFQVSKSILWSSCFVNYAPPLKKLDSFMAWHCVPVYTECVAWVPTMLTHSSVRQNLWNILVIFTVSAIRITKANQNISSRLFFFSSTFLQILAFQNSVFE